MLFEFICSLFKYEPGNIGVWSVNTCRCHCRFSLCNVIDSILLLLLLLLGPLSLCSSLGETPFIQIKLYLVIRSSIHTIIVSMWELVLAYPHEPMKEYPSFPPLSATSGDHYAIIVWPFFRKLVLADPNIQCLWFGS